MSESGLVVTFTAVLQPKKAILFYLDFKTMLTLTGPWNFLIYWSAITIFKILRELGQRLASLRIQCLCMRLN